MKTNHKNLIVGARALGLTLAGACLTLLLATPAQAAPNPPVDDYFFVVTSGHMEDASGLSFRFVGTHVGTFKVRSGKSIEGPGNVPGFPANKFRFQASADPDSEVLMEGTWKATKLESYHTYGVTSSLFGLTQTPAEAGVMRAKIELYVQEGGETVIIPAQLTTYCIQLEVPTCGQTPGPLEIGSGCEPPNVTEHWELKIGSRHFKFGGPAGTLFVQRTGSVYFPPLP